MNVLIGVDAGGTKTKVALFNSNGEIIDSVIKGFGNPVVDYNRALQNITEGIDKILNKYPNFSVKHIVLGIAGIGGIDNKNDLEKFLRERYLTDLTIINDAQLALESIIRDKFEAGILAIAGTGSVAIGKKDGLYYMTGGWGHLLGDEGSGYYISINALKRIIEEYEQGVEHSKLSKYILSNLEMDNALDIKKLVYNSPKCDIANVSRMIGEKAELGNKDALSIIYDAADKFSYTVIKLIKKISINEEKLILGLRGSVLENSEIFRNRFKENIISEVSIAFDENFKLENIYGAYYLAKNFICERDLRRNI